MTDLSLVGEAMQTNNGFVVATPDTGINKNDSFAITVSDLATVTSDGGGGCTFEDFSSRPGLNYSVISVGIVLVIENSLLIFVIASNKSLHTNTNILVASLAVTDVLMGLQCCVIGMTGLSVGLRVWLAALDSDLHAFDMFMLSINLSLVGVSLLHVFCLAVDRYLFLLWPFRYRRHVTRPKVLAVAAAIWFLGLVYTLSPLALFQNTRYRQTCIVSEGPVSFGYVPVCSVYLICLVVITYCTSGIVKIARHHRRGRVEKRMGNQGFNCCRSNPQKEKNVFIVTNQTPRAESVSNVEKDSNHVFMKSENQIQGSPLPFSIPLNFVLTRVTDQDLISFPGHLKNVDCDAHNNLPDVEEETMNSPDFAAELVANVGKPEIDFPSIGEPIIAEDIAAAGDAILLSAEDDKINVTKNTTNNTNINQPDTTSKKIYNFSDDANDETNLYLNKKDVDKSGVSNKSNMKIIKFVLVVFGTFLACTFPPIVLLSLIKIFKLSLFDGNEFIFDVLHFLITINSGMNFLTITYMNKTFRRALLKSLPFCKNNRRKASWSM